MTWLIHADSIEAMARAADRLKDQMADLKRALAHGRDPTIEVERLDRWLKDLLYELADAAMAAARREAVTQVDGLAPPSEDTPPPSGHDKFFRPGK
jgi:hypothetical protein